MFEDVDEDRGELIARMRAAKAMTQEELALAAGLSRHTVMRAEAGKPLSADTLKGLCVAFGTTPDAFVAIDAPSERDLKGMEPVAGAPGENAPNKPAAMWHDLGFAEKATVVACLVALVPCVAIGFGLRYGPGMPRIPFLILGPFLFLLAETTFLSGRMAAHRSSRKYLSRRWLYVCGLVFLAGIGVEWSAWLVHVDALAYGFPLMHALACCLLCAGSFLLFLTRFTPRNTWMNRVAFASVAALMMVFGTWPLMRVSLNLYDTAARLSENVEAYTRFSEMSKIRKLMEPEHDIYVDRYHLGKILGAGGLHVPDYDTPGIARAAEKRGEDCHEEWMRSPVYDREKCDRSFGMKPTESRFDDVVLSVIGGPYMSPLPQETLDYFDDPGFGRAKAMVSMAMSPGGQIDPVAKARIESEAAEIGRQAGSTP